ncbi:MAG: hypothetical protein M1837_003679 [Sclerophora amabilis]|nr:MAG: hypothetical protein M1837_003679 [Sclerophora amabilis]
MWTIPIFLLPAIAAAKTTYTGRINAAIVQSCGRVESMTADAKISYDNNAITFSARSPSLRLAATTAPNTQFQPYDLGVSFQGSLDGGKEDGNQFWAKAVDRTNKNGFCGQLEIKSALGAGATNFSGIIGAQNAQVDLLASASDELSGRPITFQITFAGDWDSGSDPLPSNRLISSFTSSSLPVSSGSTLSDRSIPSTRRRRLTRTRTIPGTAMALNTDSSRSYLSPMSSPQEVESTRTTTRASTASPTKHTRSKFLTSTSSATSSPASSESPCSSHLGESSRPSSPMFSSSTTTITSMNEGTTSTGQTSSGLEPSTTAPSLLSSPTTKIASYATSSTPSSRPAAPKQRALSPAAIAGVVTGTTVPVLLALLAALLIFLRRRKLRRTENGPTYPELAYLYDARPKPSNVAPRHPETDQILGGRGRNLDIWRTIVGAHRETSPFMAPSERSASPALSDGGQSSGGENRGPGVATNTSSLGLSREARPNEHFDGSGTGAQSGTGHITFTPVEGDVGVRGNFF